MMVGYVSVLLFIEITPAPRNYFGWFYIVILTVDASLTSIGKLRDLFKVMKKACFGKIYSVKTYDL